MPRCLPRVVYFKAALGNLPVTFSSSAVWKRVFDEVGPFSIGINRGGDTEMWGRIALKYPIAFSNNVSAIYFRNAANRVCNTLNTPKGDIALERSLKNALAKGEYRKEIVRESDVIHLLNVLKLERAKAAIVSGRRKKAWEFLYKVTVTRNICILLIVLSILSILPHTVMRLILSIKKFLLDQRSNLRRSRTGK